MMAEHRLPDVPAKTAPRTGIEAYGVLRRNGLLLAVANGSAALGLALNRPGNSPSLSFLALVAPLWVWAIPFGLAAVLQVLNRPLAGHTVAVAPWLMLAIGVLLGIVQGLSSAPSASVIFVGLVLYTAGHHINAMIFRRKETLARKGRR